MTEGAILIEEAVEGGGEVDGVVRVDRLRLWKRRWRGTAEDGLEIAVALVEPAKDGQVLCGGGKRFRVEQIEEEVVVIGMPKQASMAAKIGWYFGNRHLPIEVREDAILLENFPTLTASLERIGIPYEIRCEVLNCRPHSEHTH
ncbi:MAG: hypothetical protein AAGC74_03105 [Verrucomicrobiota bacterium]